MEGQVKVKGVIVAAGYGTRLLPVTRVVPKELLPIVDRPVLDVVVSELIEAGIDEIVVISSRRKRALEDWFDRDPELEAVFTREGAAAKLARIRPPAAKVAFVRQTEMAGTGHALMLARPFIGDDAFVVVFPDDVFGQPNCSAELVATFRETGRSVLSAMELPEGEDSSRYGMLRVEEEKGAGSATLRVDALVEKPPRGTESSRLVSLGRYLFTPEVFEGLEATHKAHGGGEFFHVPAVNWLARQGKVVARRVAATRYDTGTSLGYLQTIVELALRDPEIGPDFRRFLASRAD
jgi:UTP--glucose-1-phosphate uridylyltransferase